MSMSWQKSMSIASLDGAPFFPDHAKSLGGSIDITAEILHTLAFVEVVCPKRAVDKAHILYGDVLAVGEIDQTRAQGFEVRTLLVELAANPEFLPIAVAVAVDCSRSGDCEAVNAVGIHEGREILQCLSLHASLTHLEVGDAVAALQASALLDIKVCALLENSEPERNVPSGMTITPPPSAAALSITA